MNKERKIFWLAVLLALLLPDTLWSPERYSVGVCDWMVLKRQKLGVFALAKELGCDGVELDMGGLGDREAFDNQLRDDAKAALFKHTADSLGIRIGAVAMSGFYAQDLTKKDTYMSLLSDCFDTMDKMGGVEVAFLPLGGCGNDWAVNKERRAQVVKRLHDIGEAAKARGKVVGIDTPLDAKGNLVDCSVSVSGKDGKIEGLAQEVKTLLKQTHPWKTLYINGEYVSTRYHESIKFPYNLKEESVNSAK